MRRLPAANPWLMAAISWAVAVGSVLGGYAVWMRWRGEPLRWDLMREAALMVLPVALFMAWRDRNRKK